MTLLDVLNTLQGDVDFLYNPGNAGDGLIHAGWHELAKKCQLNVTHFHYPEDRTGKVLLITGAGAFCEHHWHGVEIARYYSSRYESIYILPATFETTFKPVADWLASLPPHIKVFCRERISYEAVRKVASVPGNIFIDHDMALSVDVSPWKKKGLGELLVFRTDRESCFHRIPEDNFDISMMGDERYETLILDIVQNYERIYTDRLHVAIAGTLLGRQVQLFVGAYHKIKGVYEYSLRDYPHVTLKHEADLDQFLRSKAAKAAKSRVYERIKKIPMGTSFLRKWNQAKIQKRSIHPDG